MVRTTIARQTLYILLTALVIATRPAFPAAILTTDFAKAQTFFGGSASSPVKAIAVFSNGSIQNFIDFSVSPLAIKQISADGVVDYRSINISGDGKFVAYSVKSVVYVRPVEASSTKKLQVGNGTFPTWWIHPSTKKWYILYQLTSNAINIQEVDMAGFKLVGGATQLIGAQMGDNKEMAPLNGGRSADGRFMTGDDNVHGVVELEDPLVIAGAKVKTYVFYTSPLGWQSDYSHITLNQQYAGWCNANLSPAKSSSSKFYGCAQHIGSSHTDLYIRQWPKDITKVPAPDPKNKCPSFGFDKPPTSECDPADILLHVKPKDGTKAFHGSFWSTHENYIVTKAGGSQGDGTWYGYVFDVSGLTDTKYLRFLSKALNKGNDFIHMWVQEGNTKASSRAVGSRRAVFAGLRGGRELELRGAGTTPYRASVLDVRGKTVLAAENLSGTSRVSLEGLPQGTYVVKIAAPGVSVLSARFSISQ